MQNHHSFTIGVAVFSQRAIVHRAAYKVWKHVTKSSHQEKACTSLYLYLSLLAAFTLLPSVSISLTHPHSHMCLHNHIVSHKQSSGEQRGAVMPSDGNVFQLKSHPKVTPAAPNRADGPSCHRGWRVHGTVDRSGCFTGCALSSITTPDFCASRWSQI